MYKIIILQGIAGMYLWTGESSELRVSHSDRMDRYNNLYNIHIISSVNVWISLGIYLLKYWDNLVNSYMDGNHGNGIHFVFKIVTFVCHVE